MKTVIGIAIFCQNRVLLVKNKKHNWGFPKGIKDDSDTSSKDTIIRELYEEINIKLSKNHLDKIHTYCMNFSDSRTLYVFNLKIDNISELGLYQNILTEYNKNELLCAQFMPIGDAEKVIHEFQKPIFQTLKEKYVSKIG